MIVPAECECFCVAADDRSVCFPNVFGLEKLQSLYSVKNKSHVDCYTLLPKTFRVSLMFFILWHKIFCLPSNFNC
jgi:hypothetical protein